MKTLGARRLTKYITIGKIRRRLMAMKRWAMLNVPTKMKNDIIPIERGKTSRPCLKF